MRPEYVKIPSPERIYGHKDLLNAQLETLSLLKRYQSYKSLRSHEFLLRISLKNKIEEAKNALSLLERLLPKPTIQPKESAEEERLVPQGVKKKIRRSIEQEIDDIKRRLAQLQ